MQNKVCLTDKWIGGKFITYCNVQFGPIVFFFNSRKFKIREVLLFNCRNCTGSLKECVPVLTTYDALKSQFDWVTDGGVSHLVDENLPRELVNLELYLR